MATSLLTKRQESIEFEPRTLTLEEINCAREAALYIVSTTTPEKAISIFTEGLKPVIDVQSDGDDDDDDKSNYQDEKFDYDFCMKCHAHNFQQAREIVTAPF